MSGNLDTQQHNECLEVDSDSSQNHMDTLVSLQNRKVQLAQERDALASKRLHLQQSIERLSATLTHYKDQQLQYDAKLKLELYLHQNSHEFAKLSTPDENASFVVENLDVLPSRDPQKRLDLIGKFYPGVSISDQTITSVVHASAQYNKILYTVSSPCLPSLRIELLSRDEKLNKVSISDLDTVSQILFKISPSFSEALLSLYIPESRIDLLMYSYHSLAQIQAERIKTFSALLQKYSSFVSRPQKSWSQNPTHSLMCVDYIEFAHTEKTGVEFRVRLSWRIILASRISGDVGSDLEFSIQKEGSGLLQKTNPVFISLAATHGVEKAFHILITNLFEWST